jgi:hypothetical protein
MVGSFRGSPYHRCLEILLFAKDPNMSGKELAAITDFFKLFLQINPDDRATFEEISRHRWINDHPTGG